MKPRFETIDNRDSNGIGWVSVTFHGVTLPAWANPELASREIPAGYVWAYIADDAPYRLFRLAKADPLAAVSALLEADVSRAFIVYHLVPDYSLDSIIDAIETAERQAVPCSSCGSYIAEPSGLCAGCQESVNRGSLASSAY
ncbi:hypothetical protein LCGC14_1337220 [marine sediment metagenome]|uniref:Uncharacterized protein n=1 Tax=marine sediment metagenome TaxID=412755 RepID=A0A0F9KEL4_9ZZZZ